MPERILTVKSLTKRFGEVMAVTDLSFVLEAGTITPEWRATSAAAGGFFESVERGFAPRGQGQVRSMSVTAITEPAFDGLVLRGATEHRDRGTAQQQRLPARPRWCWSCSWCCRSRRWSKSVMAPPRLATCRNSSSIPCT